MIVIILSGSTGRSVLSMRRDMCPDAAVPQFVTIASPACVPQGLWWPSAVLGLQTDSVIGMLLPGIATLRYEQNWYIGLALH